VHSGPIHRPVLLEETIRFLDLQEGDFIIDATVDGGGHAEAILKKIGEKGKFIGIDLDPRILEEARKKFAERKNAAFINMNYAGLPEMFAGERFGAADGIFLDLGFSSEQLEKSGRGFSFNPSAGDGEPLLMTYDLESKPAKDVIRGMGEKELAKTIFELSGEKFAMKIAKAVKRQERIEPITTSGQLAKVIRQAVPKNYERGRIDPATRTFQALRIYVNDELGNLRKLLGGLTEILAHGGRAVIISFHSLEDKIVKESFRKLEKSGAAEILTKKPVEASAEEVNSNPRARSAKLRALEVR